MSPKLRTAALPFLIALAVLGATTPAPAANPQVWTDFDESLLAPEPGTRINVPLAYRTLALDLAALESVLALAPMEYSGEAPATLALPMPDGSMARFRVEESPIMEPGLAARFPEIRTYRGHGIDDPAATTRFGLTSAGFHAIVLSPSATVYIDPYSRGDADHYISYDKRDVPRPPGLVWECDVHTPEEPVGSSSSLFDPAIGMTTASDAPGLKSGPGGILRTYRLAQAANFEYTFFHSTGLLASKTEAINNGIIPTINRVNGIYERDLSIHMNLIDDLELIVWDTPADPYTNESGINMLVENQVTLDALIGQENYDIGHVFSTGGGGVAFLGVVCDNTIPVQKAGGVTGLPAPTGDVFSVDFVAHEMGHQFRANHTFNGNAGSCSGNRNAATAYEVGSASTIMGYAGICGNQNLQPNSDDYFHNISYVEIRNFTTSGVADACAVKTPTGNTPPVVEAGADFTIPSRTPFTLTAAGSDADGDPITYCWEEFDLGPANDGRSDNGSSPIFRSFSPVPEPWRTFPKLSDILGNTTTYGELLPTTTRLMSFRVTARDNNPAGGEVCWDQMQVQVTADAGPFLVVQPNGGELWTGGSSQTVIWDVAGTTAPPVSTPSVDIFLSTDGGLTFPILLAAGVPNTGTASVTAPNLETDDARIKIEGAGNVFFDVSDAEFTIQQVADCEAQPAALEGSALADGFAPLTGDGDAFIDNCENADLSFSVRNTGGPDLTNVRIIDVRPVSHPGTTIETTLPAQVAPSIASSCDPASEPAVGSFNFTARGLGHGDTLLFEVDVTADELAPFFRTFTLELADAESDVTVSDVTFTFEADEEGWQVVSGTFDRTPGGGAPASLFFMASSAGEDNACDLVRSPVLRLSSTSTVSVFEQFEIEPGDEALLGFYDRANVGLFDPSAGARTVVEPDGGRAYNVPDGAGSGACADGEAGWAGAGPGFLESDWSSAALGVAGLGPGGREFQIDVKYATDTLFSLGGIQFDEVTVTDVLELGPDQQSDDCPVEPVNNPPVAADDADSTLENTAVMIDVLANDSDPEGDPLTVGPGTDMTSAEGGTVTNNGSDVTYDPPAGFSGTDTFDYEACDDGSPQLCDTATVTVTVVPDPEATEGRVHGSGHLNGLLGPGDDEDSDTDADSDSDDDSDSNKIHFSFDAKLKYGELKGKLKLKDKDQGVKIKADKDGITSLSTGTGPCNGQPLGPTSWEFTAVGTFGQDDTEIPDATFRVCGEDNGKPGKGNDRFYLECTSGCAYDTGSRVPDDVIDGGNIHIHDPIGTSKASRTQAAPPEKLLAPDVDVLELDPVLLDEAPAGSVQLFVATLFTDDGLALGAREVTLTWTDASGVKHAAASLTDGLGVAAFWVTVPAGGTELFATTGGLQSNGAYLTGTTLAP